MLWRLAFPPLALQAVMLVLGVAFCVRDAWFAPPDHVPMSDEGWEALGFFALGVLGFIIFIPLHWAVLAVAGKLRFPASGLHFVIAALGAALYPVPSNWTFALFLLLTPVFAFLGWMTWVAEFWIRRQEAREQQTVDSFVHARKQMLKQPTQS